MTKLDEAIIAAAEAYFLEPCDELDEEIADNLLAACQAFVKAVAPKRAPFFRAEDLSNSDDCYREVSAKSRNMTIDEILRNAGVTTPPAISDRAL